jgi:D-alanine-D-alanine ligase
MHNVNIGLTYDLRQDYLDAGYSEEETAEFDRPDTIDAIDDALRSLGYRTDRIGRATRLIERLAAGDRWDLVFNIAEGLPGRGREAQVPAILDTYGIPYTFSDAVVMGLTLDKALTKRLLRDQGLPTADFVVICDADEAAAVNLPFPLFAKPVGEGTGLGVSPASRVRNTAELRSTCADLLQRFHQPVLVETDLPGRELTVGVIGTGAQAEAIGALEIRTREGGDEALHSYHNKEYCEDLVDYVLVDDDEALDACRIGLAAWRALDCRDAGRIDLRADVKGRMQILEINPIAGLHPSHSDLPILWTQSGRSYVNLISAIVESASSRVAPSRTAPSRAASARNSRTTAPPVSATTSAPESAQASAHARKATPGARIPAAR